MWLETRKIIDKAFCVLRFARAWCCLFFSSSPLMTLLFLSSLLSLSPTPHSSLLATPLAKLSMLPIFGRPSLAAAASAGLLRFACLLLLQYTATDRERNENEDQSMYIAASCTNYHLTLPHNCSFSRAERSSST